jgi:drug/metabolite transporter (DMT)-like permease
VPVTQAYPLLSLGYAIMLLAGWWLLGEVPSPMRVIGVGVIIAGVVLVAAS